MIPQRHAGSTTQPVVPAVRVRLYPAVRRDGFLQARSLFGGVER